MSRLSSVDIHLSQIFPSTFIIQLLNPTVLLCVIRCQNSPCYLPLYSIYCSCSSLKRSIKFLTSPPEMNYWPESFWLYGLCWLVYCMNLFFSGPSMEGEIRKVVTQNKCTKYVSMWMNDAHNRCMKKMSTVHVDVFLFFCSWMCLKKTFWTLSYCLCDSQKVHHSCIYECKRQQSDSIGSW